MPEDLYAELRIQAGLSRMPTTTFARNALEQWLKEKRRSDLQQAIEAYATENAGSVFDLDQALENAAVDRLLDDEVPE